MADFQVSGQFVETLNVRVASARFSSAIVEVLHEGIASNFRTSGFLIEVLRTSVTNPFYASGMVTEVLHQGTGSLRTVGIITEVLHQGERAVRMSGIIVEVLRVSHLPPPDGAGGNKRNRIVSVHSM